MNSRITWILVGWLVIAVAVSFFLHPKEEAPRKLTIQTRVKREPLAVINDFKDQLLAKLKSTEAAVDPLPQQDGTIPHEYNLTFKNPEDFQKFLEVARSKHIQVLGKIDKLNAVRIRVADADLFKDLMKNSPEPKEQSPNFIARAPDIPNPNDLTDQQNLSGFGDKTMNWLGVPTDHQSWGKDITVAVLDTGISKSDALKGKNITSIDLTNPQNSSGLDGSYHGHGTAVASLIAGTSTYVNGIAPSSNLLSVRVLSSDGIGDTFTVAQGIMEAVDRGARVINMSLGSQGDSTILRDAVSYALEHGVAIVAAAGNESMNQLSYPARYPGVIAVGAIDAQEQHLAFSNTGNGLGLVAPGYGVYASWTDNQMISFTGTSAAAPLISGALATILSQNPYMSGLDARDILYQYSNDTGAPGMDSEFGYGVLDMQRIINRNQTGINDIAVSSNYILQDSPYTASLLVSAQNRGTERLGSVQLNVSYGGVNQTYYFTDVDVGKTVTQRIPMDITYVRTSGSITVSSSATIPGKSDIKPFNNQSTSMIRPAVQ